jgi:ferredoxin
MTDFAAIEKKIRDQARQWFKNGEVKYVIGYEKGYISPLCRPVIIDNIEEVDRLVWNSACIDNLTRYLVDEMKKKPKKREEPDLRPIGIIVKPCDSKTIVELIKENIVPRERVKIIGVISKGSIDPKKLEEKIQKMPLTKRTNINILEKNNDFILESEVGKTSFPKDELIADKCKVCVTHNPVIADLVVGEKEKESQKDNFEDLKDIEKMTSKERWKFWEKELSNCVRCYACKSACSLCYCEECIFERTKPYRWNEKSVKLSQNLFYHLVRAMHLAGRCVDCSECERVCPMDIPIRKFNRFLLKRAKDRFNVNPGINIDDKPMFGSFDMSDLEEEIW